MALLKELKGSFVGGQVSPELQNRIDLEKFNTFLKEAKNTKIKPEGGISNRAGTIFIGKVKDATFRLTINVNVSATVIVNGEEYTGKTVNVNLPADSEYTYFVGAVGYETKSGSGTLDENKVVNVKLEADANTYTFTIDNGEQGATITINGTEQSSLTASAGTYIEWSVEKEGYISQSGSLILNEDTTEEIELDPISTFVLTINTTPSNANVKVKKNDEVVFEGVSPSSVTLEAGSAYSYEISMSGYITEEGGGILNADTTITTTLQQSKVEITNIKLAFKNSKATTYTVNHLLTYSIKKTGTYKIQIGGSKGHYGDYTTKGGTAILQTTFTSGDNIKIYRIDGGSVFNGLYTVSYGGCGVGIKVNDVWALVVGGGGAITEQNSYLYGSGGGGYNGGQTNYNSISGRYLSKGISYNGNQGNGTGNNSGSGQSSYYGPSGNRFYAYGGTGYVKSSYSGSATLTTGNNSSEGYAKIDYLG